MKKPRTKKYSNRVKDPSRVKKGINPLGYVLFSITPEEVANSDKFEKAMLNKYAALSLFAKGEATPSAMEHLTYAALRTKWLNDNIGLPFDGENLLKETIRVLNQVHRRLIKWAKLEMTEVERDSIEKFLKWMLLYFGQFPVIDIDKATFWANTEIKKCAQNVIDKNQTYIEG